MATKHYQGLIDLERLPYFQGSLKRHDIVDLLPESEKQDIKEYQALAAFCQTCRKLVCECEG